MPKEKKERKRRRCAVGLATALIVIALNVLRRFVTTRPIKLLNVVPKEEKKAPTNKDSRVVRLGENF